MPFLSNTDAQRAAMLAEIGLSEADLFAAIPPQIRAGPLNLEEGLSEQEVRAHMAALAGRNASGRQSSGRGAAARGAPGLTSFLGGGFYDHFAPAAADALASRSEFYTAYTPYQPEASQGTLQSIYEYQSMICRLTEMEVANASLYDGGTALYEAITMSLRITGRNRVLVDEGVNPIHRKMIRSYTGNLGIELVETPCAAGRADRAGIEALLNDQTAAVVVQTPNFFGCIDDATDLSALAHKRGALLVVACYPISLGLLKTPGAMGADIVTAEGQSLGLGLSFGGPYLGIMATRQAHMRKMPGRICGRTVDSQGREGFVLTLQAREQHIRREKATSNICTNQNLCALNALLYLCLLGKEGLRAVAQLCADKAWYAQKRLLEIEGVSLRFPRAWYFNEFVLELPARADRVIRRLLEKDLAAGFPLDRYYQGMENSLLVAVTEKRTKAEIDYFAHALEVCL